MLIFVSLHLGISFCAVNAQPVKDPLLDYFTQGFSKVDFAVPQTDDGEGPFTPITPQTRIYTFEATLEPSKRKFVFITSEVESLGPHGDFAWSVYGPLKAGGYKRLPDGFVAHLSGPVYIGYVPEVKVYGIVDAGKHVVSVQYWADGKFRRTFLGKDQEAEVEDFPQYFASPAKWNIHQYTLAQLRQKYPNVSNPSATPPSK